MQPGPSAPCSPTHPQGLHLLQIASCVVHLGTITEGVCLTDADCACSVLEPGRTLTLAEKGGAGAEVVTAAPGFRLVATMNPGGDYGKKELSPALSNRFTQVPSSCKTLKCPASSPPCALETKTTAGTLVPTILCLFSVQGFAG